jgi:hypothetical protein
MKKFFGFVAVGALVLVIGSNLTLAGVDRDSNGNDPRGQQISRVDNPSQSLETPGLFNALMNWLIGNHGGKEFPGKKDRDDIQDAPDQVEMGVGGCRGVGGCGGWL